MSPGPQDYRYLGPRRLFAISNCSGSGGASRRRDYRDFAITSVTEDEEEHLALYEVPDAAKSAVARIRVNSWKSRAIPKAAVEVAE